MSDPSKDAEFNDALKRMLDAKPKQNDDLKKKNRPTPSKLNLKPAKNWK